jgi:YhcH/YjgK/YiaL family protein
MIIDQIQNRVFYRQLGSRIGEALDYLAATDFAKMPDGKYELDGPRMFALVQRYRPKPLAEIVWEAHRKYIDVQFIVEGVERMGYVPLGQGMAIKQDYDPQRDIVFYDTLGDLFTVPEGGFVVFASQDVHAPGLAVDGVGADGKVLKVVVKVAGMP